MVIGGPTSLNSASYGVTTLPAKPAPTPEQQNKLQTAAQDAQTVKDTEQAAQQPAVRTAAVGVAETENRNEAIEAYVNSSNGSDNQDVNLASPTSGRLTDLYQQQQRAESLQMMQKTANSPLQQKMDEMTGSTPSTGIYVSTRV